MNTELFNGSCWNKVYGDDSHNGNLDCESAWWLSSLFRDSPDQIFQVINSTIDALATAVTDKLRTTGAGPEPSEYGPNFRKMDGPVQVRGSALQITVCAYFDWPWLLLPGGLVAADLVLLVIMVVSSYHGGPRRPVWKSSILPLLFHGLRGSGSSSPADAAWAGAMDLRQLETESAKMLVRFVADGTEPAGFKFVSEAPGQRGEMGCREGDSADSLLAKAQGPTL